MLTHRRAIGVTVAAAGTALAGVVVVFVVALAAALSGLCSDSGQCGEPTSNTEALVQMGLVWLLALAVVGFVVRTALGASGAKLVGAWRVAALAAVWAPFPALLFGVGWWIDHSANTSFETATFCAIGAGLGFAAGWCLLLIEVCKRRANGRESAE